MGAQQPKTEKSVKDVAKKAKNPASAMQAVTEAEPLAQLADPMVLQRAMANPRGLSPKAIPGLQRKLGNQYVQMMLAGAAQHQSPSRIAGGIQAQMVEDYAQQPDHGGLGQITQRAPDADGGVELPDSMSDAINQGVSAGGKSLPQDTQVEMKQDLGIANPDQIQVHHDATADALSKSLGAKAFTTGSHIFFRQGEYDPGSAKGQSLLYHESVHTMQQSGTKPKSPQTKTTVNPPDDKYEQEADTVTEQAMSTPEPGGPRFAAPNTAPSAPGKALEDEGAAEEFSEDEVLPTGLGTSTVLPLQMAEDEGDEEKEEAKEKGDEVTTELEDNKEKSKKGAKEKGKEKGKEKAEAKEKEVKKVPKPEKAKPPEKIDPGLSLPEPAVDSTEVKYEAETEPEEPEMADPPLPTWEELAAGTVQMSPEDVAVELGIRQTLIGEEGDIELGAETEEAASFEEEGEELDRGALIGDALSEGALEGFTEGMSSFIADQAVEVATSKIPYFDGFVNMAQIAHDPSAWAADNVMSIGTGAVDMVKGFAAIGDEDTAWGYMAATLEALIGVFDLVNQIIGLINTIFTIILALARVMAAVGSAMMALAPTAPFCILCWMYAPGSVLNSLGWTIISFIEPINDFLSLVSNALNFIKFLLNPLIMVFRILDILETEADPEKLKEKQEKLKGATKGFTQYATEQAANRTKDAAVDGINRNLDKRKMKKAEGEAEHGPPRKPGESDEDYDSRKADARDKFDKMKEDYEGTYGKGAYEADKQRGWKGVMGAQAKKAFTGTPLDRAKWKKGLKGLKGAPGEARKTWREKREEAKAARTKAPVGATYAGVGAMYRSTTARSARRKAREAEEDYEAKKLAYEAEETNTTKKGEAWLYADPGSEQEKRASDEYTEAQHRRDKAKEEADAAKAELEKRKQRQREEEEALSNMMRQYGQRQEWSEQERKRLREGAKKAWGEHWKDIGKWRGGAFAGGAGGQRHGPGVTGPAVDFFKDVLGFDFGREAMRRAFGGKEKTDALELLKEEQEAIQDGDTQKAAELTPKVDDAVAKMDLASEIGKLEDMRAVLDKMSWALSAASEDDARENIFWQQKLVQRIEQVQQARGTSAAEEWAKDYGWIKPVYLVLETTGLGGYPRKDPNAPVFVIKMGRKGGIVGEALAYTGLEIEASQEIKVTETSHTEEIMMYKGMRLSVDPQPVELLQPDQTTLRYEPNKGQTTVEIQEATDSQQGSVTVTVPYEEANTVQVKLQRAPDEAEIDPLASPVPAPATDQPDIELQPMLDKAALASPPSQADASIQRAPDDETEESAGEPIDAAALEFAEDEAEMEAEAEAEEEAEAEAMELGEEGAEGGMAASLISMEYQARLLEMLPSPPEGAIERIQGAALAYDEVDAEEYGLRLQQQQIAGLQQHGLGQVAEVQGVRQLTAAHEKGVAKQQADTEAKLQAQDQMRQASQAKEGNAQKTADESGGVMEAFGGIFNKILQGFGLPIGGESADAGGAKEGIEQQADQTQATSKTTKDATKLSQKRTGETQKVKEEAAGVQNELGSFDDQMAEEEAGVKEGMAELGEAQGINEEQLTTAQEGKEQLRDQHASALAEAEIWAIEHRLIREEILGELEEALEAEPEEEAEMAF